MDIVEQKMLFRRYNGVTIEFKLDNFDEVVDFFDNQKNRKITGHMYTEGDKGCLYFSSYYIEEITSFKKLVLEKFKDYLF